MKKIKFLVISFVIFVTILFLFSKFFVHYCGYRGVFGGANADEFKCNCTGKIIESGGPRNAADDGGYFYTCIGIVNEVPT